VDMGAAIKWVVERVVVGFKSSKGGRRWKKVVTGRDLPGWIEGF